MMRTLKRHLIFIIAALLVGLVVGYYLGYDHGFEKAAKILVKP